MISPSMRKRLEFGAKTFLVVAFLGSLTAGVARLQQKALADERHDVDLGAWTIVQKPAWCTADDVRALRDVTRLDGWHTSLLHPEGGPVVWRSLERAPQVARVVALQKRFPSAFDVVVELRRPVAAVRVGPPNAPRWVEVDAHGVAVAPPVAARPVRDGRPLRVVAGASGVVPKPGEPFGPDVAEAADLSAEFDRFGTDADQALLGQLDEIDVSNFGGRRNAAESEILVRMGPRASAAERPAPAGVVEWGRARRSDPYDPEPGFGAKASRLAEALRLFPGLAGLKTVKVAFDDLVVVPTSNSPLSRK